MKKFKFLKLLPLVLILLLLGCSKQSVKPQTQDNETIHISAAASLKDVLKEISNQYQKDHPNIKLEFDFAGSGQIVQRVENGAPVDGVLLASEADIAKLTKKNLANSKSKFAGNSLVLISNKKTKTNNPKTLLNSASKIAIGNPNSVPAGRYAKQSLISLNLWDSLQSKLVTAQDVRQVLSYVESGNTEYGFVYQTDKMTSDQVYTINSLSDKLHDDIGYYSGIVDKTKHQKSTKQFLNYLQSTDSQTKFKKFGFKIK